jgi:hypothetical protein
MTVSNKERAAMVLESAHYTVKEIAFSLAMEVDFDPMFMTTERALTNAMVINRLKDVRDAIRSVYNLEMEDGEAYWTYTAPSVSTHPQNGMSYSLLSGIDGWIWGATSSLIDKNKDGAIEGIMMALVLFNEFKGGNAK